MENLRDYIKIYNNILDEQFLAKLVESVNAQSFEKIELEGISFEQTSISDKNLKIAFEGEDVTLEETFSSLIYNASVLYFEDVKVPLLPELQGFEGLKIRKFTEGQAHNLHLDVNDYKSAKRFLTVLIFLGSGNVDVTFPSLKTTIRMSNNSVMLFPPTWMFPYEIKGASQEPAYAVTSHLHYV